MGRLVSGGQRAIQGIAALWSAQPVSVVIAGLQLAGFVAFYVLAGPRGFHAAGLAGSGSRLFLIQRPAEVLIGVAATLVLVGASERRIGGRRAAAAYVVECLVAAFSSVGVHVAVEAIFRTHVAVGFRVAFVPAYAPAVGTIIAASAFAGPLWRRRIRVASLSGAASFVLFEGNFSGLVTLVVALTGLLLGSLLRNGRTPRRVEWVRSSHHERRVLLSLVVSVSAGGLLATVVGRTPVGPLEGLGGLFRDPLPHRAMSMACRVAATDREGEFLLNPYGACTAALARQGLDGPGAVALGIAPLVVLLVCAFYLRRGLRAALVTAVAVNVVLAAAAFVQLLLLPDPGSHRVGVMQAVHVLLTATSSVIPFAIAVLLLVNQRHARIRSSRRFVIVGSAAVVAAAVILVAAYVAAVNADDEALQQPASTGSLIVTGLLRLLPFGFSGVAHLGSIPLGVVPRALFTNMGWAFWAVVAGAVVLMCRHRTAQVLRPESDQLRDFLHRGGSGSLAHMTTWEGNQVWFDPGSRGAVGYRLVGDVAITLGDPIGREQDAGHLVASFATWCDDRGYVPVFYSARSSLRPVFAAIGWYDLPVGEETIVRPRTFSMQGKKWQDVRSSVNRAAKWGLRAEWTSYADLPQSWRSQITDISEQWVADKKLPEMGFTLGGLPELRDHEVRLMLGVTDDSRVEAVTSWLPSFRDGTVVGWTLDFMRRRPDSMNGVMEFVIASNILRAQEDDLEFVSLSAAPLVSTGEAVTPVDRVLDFLSRSLEPAYGFRSLFAFKKKFQPEYQELIMAYPDPLLLPRIGTALTRAYLPELAPRHLARLLRRNA